MSRLKEALFSRDLDSLRAVPRWGLRAARLTYLAVVQFRGDYCFEKAASLTFATIISLFPLTVLFVTIAGSLGEGDKIIDYVKRELIPFVAADFQEPLNRWLDESISSEAFREWPTGLINMIAGVALLVTALGVLVTAERTFNRIWKVPGRRTYFQQLTTFWVILTTSPFMIALSMAVEQLFLQGAGIREVAERIPLVSFLYGIVVPVAIGFLAFTLIFLFLPSTRVRLRSAMAGGILAALLWEISKHGFYIYLRSTGREANFYQHVAAIPIFLFWLYITWAIILFGGEVSYAHQNLRLLTKEMPRKPAERHFSRPFLGVYLLARIGDAFRGGRPAPRTEVVSSELDLEDDSLAEVAGWLADEGYLVENAQSPGSYTLARSPATIAVADVVRRLGDEEFPAEASLDTSIPALGSGRVVGELFRRIRAAVLETAGETTLDDLTAEIDVATAGQRR